MTKKTTGYRDRGSDTPDAPIGVVRIDTAAQAAKVEQAEQVPLFEIDGTVYSIAKVQRADIALRVMELTEQRGGDAAASYLLEETIGADGTAALARVKGLEAAQFNAIMKAVRKIALPKDRGRRG